MQNQTTAFEWHRPKDVAMSIHLDFVRQATEAIGADNADLLAAVDTAMNSPEPLVSVLSLTETEASSMADAYAAKGSTDSEKKTLRRQFLAHLACIHEIATRRTAGPALFERQLGVAKCPDFLPPTPWQVPESRMSLYTLMSRLWNWGTVLTFPLIFPLIILPVFLEFVFTEYKFRVAHAVLLALLHVVAVLWVAGIVLFALGYFACRSMRGKPVRPF